MSERKYSGYNTQNAKIPMVKLYKINYPGCDSIYNLNRTWVPV